MNIPTIILEEHHEAFIAWSYAAKNNIIGKNNLLLHFDDHSDLRVPILNTSAYGLLKMDISELKKFVYNELCIDTFIIPAIYTGIISNLIWIRRGMPKKVAMDMYVRTYNGEGKKFISDKITEVNSDDSIVNYTYAKNDCEGFKQYDIENEQSVLLDIDLDYFSCCETPDREIILEITKQEYEDFNADKYHVLNFITSNIRAIQHNGGYFYLINNYDEVYPGTRELDEEAINYQIEIFIKALLLKKVNPKIITICRSRYSGFTPVHQWEMIERKLLGELSLLYSLDVMNVNQL